MSKTPKWDDTSPVSFEDTQPVDEVPAPVGPGVVESGLLGASQGATLGFGDEASAALELGLGRATDLLRKEKLYKDASYADMLQNYREDIARAKEANPTAFTVGEVISGGIVTAPFGGIGGAAKTIRKAMTIGKAIKTGAAIGSVSALGTSDNKKWSDVVTGAISGGAFGIAGHTLGKMLNSGKVLKDVADEFSARTTGMAKSQIRRIGLKKMREIGELLQTEGITNRPTTLREILKSTSTLAKKEGGNLDTLYAAAEKVIPEGPMTSKGILGFVKKALMDAEEYVDPKVVESVQTELSALLSKVPPDKNLGVRSMWKLSQKLDDVVDRYGRSKLPADESTADGVFKATNKIRQATSDWISAMYPELGDQIKQASSLYSSLINAKSAAMGAFQDRVGKLPVFIGGVLQSTPVRSTIQAVAINPAKFITKLPGRFGPVLEEAAKRGGQALAATHYTLLQQDPEYREIVEKQQNTETEEEVE